MKNRNIIKFLAEGVSIVFHPLFLFLYLMFYLVYFTNVFMLYRYSPHLWMLFVYVFLNSIVIPMVLILFYNRDIMMRKRENRTIPYLIMVVVYGFMYYFFMKFYLSGLILRFLLGLIAGLIVLTIINFYYKFSLHTFAMGTLLAFFLRIYLMHPQVFFYPLVGMLVLAGLAGSARLALDAHTKGEIAGGYCVGLLVSSVVLFI